MQDINNRFLQALYYIKEWPWKKLYNLYYQLLKIAWKYTYILFHLVNKNYFKPPYQYSETENFYENHSYIFKLSYTTATSSRLNQKTASSKKTILHTYGQTRLYNSFSLTPTHDQGINLSLFCVTTTTTNTTISSRPSTRRPWFNKVRLKAVHLHNASFE